MGCTEAMSWDFGDPNMFLTLINDPHSTYDTRALLHRLDNRVKIAVGPST